MNAQRSAFTPLGTPLTFPLYYVNGMHVFEGSEQYLYLWWTDENMQRLHFSSISIPPDVRDVLMHRTIAGHLRPVHLYFVSATHANVFLFSAFLPDYGTSGIESAAWSLFYVVCDPVRILRYGKRSLAHLVQGIRRYSYLEIRDYGQWTWDGRYARMLFYSYDVMEESGPEPSVIEGTTALWECTIDTVDANTTIGRGALYMTGEVYEEDGYCGTDCNYSIDHLHFSPSAVHLRDAVLYVDRDIREHTRWEGTSGRHELTIRERVVLSPDRVVVEDYGTCSAEYTTYPPCGERIPVWLYTIAAAHPHGYVALLTSRREYYGSSAERNITQWTLTRGADVLLTLEGYIDPQSVYRVRSSSIGASMDVHAWSRAAIPRSQTSGFEVVVENWNPTDRRFDPYFLWTLSVDQTRIISERMVTPVNRPWETTVNDKVYALPRMVPLGRLRGLPRSGR